MQNLEAIKLSIERSVPGAQVQIIRNPSLSQQHSLLVDHEHALEIARFLRDDPEFGFDYVSNVTGIDWLEAPVEHPSVVRSGPDPVVAQDKGSEQSVAPGYLEAVYHLFSMRHRHGPVILRLRTGNRTDRVDVPSLTPIWRGAELQEREVFDLFGIRFGGHPDLRRILMWDGFEDYPMRRDYISPDDFEYEPTPHDQVLERARSHHPQRPSNT